MAHKYRVTVAEPFAEPELSPVHETAVLAAAMRALHLLRDGEPKIFCDTLAASVAGWSTDDVLRAASDGRLTGSTATFVLRSRITEDRLEELRQEGITQYVVLGAGLDTYALRNAGRLSGLTVYEVDDAPMQRWKQWRVRRLGWEVPEGLRFVECDLATASADEALLAAGWKREEPSFVSWLGVSMYLTKHAVTETLRWAAGLAAGSELVLTYMDRAATMLYELSKRQAGGDAPTAPRPRLVQSLYTAWEMRAALADAGLVEVRLLPAGAVEKRWFAERADGLSPPALERIAFARSAGRALATHP